jgi:hypothetical protein
LGPSSPRTIMSGEVATSGGVKEQDKDFSSENPLMVL